MTVRRLNLLFRSKGMLVEICNGVIPVTNQMPAHEDQESENAEFTAYDERK